jgi:hypothetical protein
MPVPPGSGHREDNFTVRGFGPAGRRTSVTAPNLSLAENHPASPDERNAFSEVNFFNATPSLVTLPLVWCTRSK